MSTENTRTARDDIAAEWAKHLDTCMDIACETCKDYEAKFYGITR